MDIVQRFDNSVFVRSRFPDDRDEQALTPQEEEDGVTNPLHTLDPDDRFVLSNPSLEKLKKDNVPDAVLNKLQPLIGRKFASERYFLDAMAPLLTSAELHDHKGKLLKHAFKPVDRVLTAGVLELKKEVEERMKDER